MLVLIDGEQNLTAVDTDGEQNLTAVALSEGINVWLWICMRPYLLSGGRVIHAACGGGINDHALLGKSKIHIDMTNTTTIEEHYVIRIAGILPCKSGQLSYPPQKNRLDLFPEKIRKSLNKKAARQKKRSTGSSLSPDSCFRCF